LARDLLAHGIKNAEDAGFEVVGHVHDEIITVIDDGDHHHREQQLTQLIACMTDLPDWGGNAPVGATGWVGRAYMKD